jgi:hypothetical protein
MLKAEVEAASVVVLGRFNPAIFQPIWFGVQNLITPKDAESAKLVVIHPEIAAFSTGWFSLQVTVDRLQIETTNPIFYPLIRDLTTGTFGILSHTPVTRMGINTRRHYKSESEQEWNAIGNSLAPKAPWKEVLEAPGMRALVMWGKRPGTAAEKIEVRVEPESHGRDDRRIMVATNHEYVLRKGEGAVHINELLNAEWDGALAYGRSAAESLLKVNIP